MNHTILLLINVSAFGFAGFYLWQASRVGRFAVIVFLATIVYALGVELTEVITSHPYYYENLLLMVGKSPEWVPLGVCLFWACYVFACMRLTDMLGLKWYERSPVDALIAVSIDFVGDPAVSGSRMVGELGEWCNDLDTPIFGGLGAWVWCVPAESATWFSVPFENFFAWFLVVGILSFFLRFAQEKWIIHNWVLWRQLAIVVGIMVLAGILVLLGVDAFSYLGDGRVWVQWVLLAGVFALPGIILFRARSRLVLDNPFDWKLVSLPVASVLACIGIFIWFGVDHDRWPWAVLQLVLAGVVSLGLICLPFLRKLLRRG